MKTSSGNSLLKYNTKIIDNHHEEIEELSNKLNDIYTISGIRDILKQVKERKKYIQELQEEIDLLVYLERFIK